MSRLTSLLRVVCLPFAVVGLVLLILCTAVLSELWDGVYDLSQQVVLPSFCLNSLPKPPWTRARVSMS